MISLERARSLQTTGVRWSPVAGDRFVIDEPQLLGQVFWVSDLTIEVHHYATDTVLGFNGTTEWALDSVPLDKALWLPREDQLRELLGGLFRHLERGSAGWTVTVQVRGQMFIASDDDVENAYADALLTALG